MVRRLRVPGPPSVRLRSRSCGARGQHDRLRRGDADARFRGGAARHLVRFGLPRWSRSRRSASTRLRRRPSQAAECAALRVCGPTPLAHRPQCRCVDCLQARQRRSHRQGVARCRWGCWWRFHQGSGRCQRRNRGDAAGAGRRTQERTPQSRDRRRVYAQRRSRGDHCSQHQQSDGQCWHHGQARRTDGRLYRRRWSRADGRRVARGGGWHGLAPLR